MSYRTRVIAPRFLALLLAVLAPLAVLLQAQSNFATPYAFTTFAGRAASGDTDGTGSAARFRAPTAVAVDASGNVYVADSMSNTIRKITVGGVVTTFGGSAGLSGSTDGTGSAARFSYPSGVAVDSAGNVYVADYYNSTIRKITSGGVVTTFAGAAGSVGSADGLGTAAQFRYPHDVAVDASGNVYVADSSNHTIRKITPAGLVSTFAGTAGNYGSIDATGSAAQFNAPQGLAVDSSNNVYVADINNHTIRKITPAGVVTTLAGLAGSPGTADGTGSAARFWSPLGVAVDGSGNVYVAANLRIRRITAAGVVTTYSDTSGTKGWTAGTGTPVQFNYPEGVAVDSAGAVYVADLFNYSVRKISTDAMLTTLAGISSSAGFANGSGSVAQFDWPAGVAVDGVGNLYIAEVYNSTIRKISAAGVTTTIAGSAGTPGLTNAMGTAAQFSAPFGVAVDGADNVYVADTNNQAIRKITPAGAVTTLATLLYSPRAIATDTTGNLYVADDGSTISKITSGGVVTVLAGLAGSQGSNDGTGTAARFNQPLGVAVDGAGNVYVADNQNCTIRKITSAGVVTTLAGIAGAERTVTDGTGSNARFADPVGVAVDSVGNIFVIDNGLEMIRRITPAGVVTTLAGGNWGSRDGTGGGAQFTNMHGIAVDGSGILWVTDSINNTIRKGVLAPPMLTSATTSSGDLNQSFNYTATFSGEPTSYTASGLPGGLNCNVATGVIMGIPTAAGSFVVTLGATNGAGTGTATFTLTIAKGNQTISFGALADKIFGAAPFTVSATADSGLSSTFSIVSGPATIFGQTVTLTGAGTVVVRASQGGDTDYIAAADVDQSFAVAKAAASVTLGSMSATFDGSTHAATATTNPASLMVNFTYDGSATAPSAAGTYAIVGTISDPNYQGFASGTLSIAKATPTITWTTPNVITYGNALSDTQFNATANVAGTFVYSPAAGTVLNAGTQSLGVTFTPTDGTNYNVATKSVDLAVVKAPLTVTAVNKSRIYGEANPVFTAVFSGFVNGDTTSVVTGSPAFTTPASSASDVGTYAITPAVGTLVANNYSFSAFDNGTLTVTKVPLTVTADNKAKLQGTANPALTVSYAGFVNGDSAGSLTTEPATTTTAVINSPIGSYPITTTGGVSANYSFIYAAGMLSVVTESIAPSDAVIAITVE